MSREKCVFLYFMGAYMEGIKVNTIHLLLVSALLFTACNNAARSAFRADNQVDFDTIRVQERHYLEEDSTKPYCDVQVVFVYPVTSSGVDVDSLQRSFVKHIFGTPYQSLMPTRAVNGYVKSFVENYRADAAAYKESASDIKELSALLSEVEIADSEHALKEHFYSYYESLSDSVVYNQYGLIAFQVKQSNNKGGAISYDSYRNYVINVHNGSQVTENDIFNPGYDTALQSVIINSLLEQHGVKTISELEELGFFGVQEIVPNRNFLLNDKGIIYTYNKGEYSAYQIDAPQVFIPYAAILSLLRENSVAEKLAYLQ